MTIDLMDGEKSVKLSDHIRSQAPSSPQNSTQYGMMSNAASKAGIKMINKRGITPAPSIPLKLVNSMNKHESDYNIITNRDPKGVSNSPMLDVKMLSQQNRDYRDYTKSEYSFDYAKSSGAKKFSLHRVARKYKATFDGRKEREIPNFVRELITDDDKLIKIVEEVYALKKSLNSQDICLYHDEIFETILKNFDLMDKQNAKEITNNFEKLFENGEVEMIDQINEVNYLNA